MLKDKQFTRKKEDFVCENCDAHVEGSGYTNHCPKCLWSKHVDIHPGDRRSLCDSLMEPTSVEQKRGEYVIVHTCKKCGHNKRNKVESNDDFDEVIRISKKIAEK